MPTDLWTFAITVYARPGVEAASLELQQAGADVCVLLCAAWLGQRGVPWRPEYQARLQALAAPWQSDVVGPLRHLRQMWRLAAEADKPLAGLREEIKKLELEAERQLLTRLEQLASNWPPAVAQDLELWLDQALPAHARSHRAAVQVLRDSMTAD